MSLIPPQHVSMNASVPTAKSNGVPRGLQADSGDPLSAGGGLPRIDALYFHVPFCFHKCHYCDFYSIVDAEQAPVGGKAGNQAGDLHADAKAPPARQRPFLERLLAELNHRSTQAVIKPSTIFVGGGTPTLLSAELWRQWLAVMRQAGILDRVVEFTVEANPETVTPELMAVLAQGGVNRISLGAQSFQPPLLKVLERWHDPLAVGQAAAMARAAGITNINLDLIFAIPGQTMAMLDADLDMALSLDPTHLSCYSLIFEPNTAMVQRMKLGQITPMDEETERAMYARVIERLAAAGFLHYEVSNWGKGTAAGKEDDEDRAAAVAQARTCQHNLLYWRNANWLGIGPAAASHVNGHRWKNEPHLGRYLATTGENPEPPTMDHEHLPAEQSIGEQLMLHLRLLAGVEHQWLAANLAGDDPRHATFEELIGLGMLERTPTHLRLTREGLFIADAVLTKLL